MAYYSTAAQWRWNCTVPTSLWRHSEHNGVSNHQLHGCLLNRLFRRKSKKTPKNSVTDLCVCVCVWGGGGGGGGGGIRRWPVESLHKGPVTPKMFPFDDVIMTCRCCMRNSPRRQIRTLSEGSDCIAHFLLNVIVWILPYLKWFYGYGS